MQQERLLRRGCAERLPAPAPAPAAGRRSAAARVAGAEPTACRAGRRRRIRCSSATRPRRSSRRSASVPSSAAACGPPSWCRRSSRARWRSVSWVPSPVSAARAGRGQLGDQGPLGARARRPRPAPASGRAPGRGSSSTRGPSSRRAPPDRPGSPGGSTASGSASRSGASSDVLGELHDHAQRALAPERDPQQRADVDLVCLAGADPVVERALDRARAGQRLDAGDGQGLVGQSRTRGRGSDTWAGATGGAEGHGGGLQPAARLGHGPNLERAGDGRRPRRRPSPQGGRYPRAAWTWSPAKSCSSTATRRGGRCCPST